MTSIVYVCPSSLYIHARSYLIQSVIYLVRARKRTDCCRIPAQSKLRVGNLYARPLPRHVSSAAKPAQRYNGRNCNELIRKSNEVHVCRFASAGARTDRTTRIQYFIEELFSRASLYYDTGKFLTKLI